MIKKIFSLALCLFAFACSASYEDEISHTLEQPLPACLPWIHTTYGVSQFGSMNIVVKTANLGTATCSYKVSVDLYKNGTTYGGPIHNVVDQAPYNSSTGTPVKNTSSLFSGISRTCTYDVWFKVGTGSWTRDTSGPFWC
jgi:hypothetical protein